MDSDVCIHLLRYECETKGEDLFLFQIIFPSIYVPQKTNEGRRQLAKVIVIIWKPSSVFLVNDYDLDSPLKASRYRNKHILVSCDEEFPPDNVNRSIYPSRKNGADFVGECILPGDQNAPWFIYITDREWLLLTVNAGNKLSSRRYEILDMKNENRAAMSMLNWYIVTFFSLYETCSSTYSLISWVNFSHFFNRCVVCLLVNFGAKSSSEKEF